MSSAASHATSTIAPSSASPANYQASPMKRVRATKAAVGEMAPNADIEFERIAVERWQIEEWNLPTRPTKPSDTRAKNFGDISVELDAIHPDRLRSLVAAAIENHLPRQQLKILKAAEGSERKIIRQLVGDAVNGGRP
jgi:hypothetical protein